MKLTAILERMQKRARRLAFREEEEEMRKTAELLEILAILHT